AQGLANLAGRALHRLVALRVDQDLAERFGTEESLRRRDGHDDDLLDVEADRASLLQEDAGDPATPVADLEPLAESAVRPEELLSDLGADHADAGIALRIALGQEATLRQRPAPHAQQLRRRSDDRHLALAAAPRRRRLAHDDRRDVAQ